MWPDLPSSRGFGEQFSGHVDGVDTTGCSVLNYPLIPSVAAATTAAATGPHRFHAPYPAVSYRVLSAVPQMTTGVTSKRLEKTGEFVKGDFVSASKMCVVCCRRRRCFCCRGCSAVTPLLLRCCSAVAPLLPRCFSWLCLSPGSYRSSRRAKIRHSSSNLAFFFCCLFLTPRSLSIGVFWSGLALSDLVSRSSRQVLLAFFFTRSRLDTCRCHNLVASRVD